MANDTQISIIGNLTGDPELRFTPGGVAVANFTVASTPRAFDKAAGEFKDGDPLFLRVSVWRKAAENVAESLVKGDRVMVRGNLVQRQYTDKDGNQKSSYEIQAEEVGASLLFRSFVHQTPTQGRTARAVTEPEQGDPWATPGPGASGDQPPF